MLLYGEQYEFIDEFFGDKKNAELFNLYQQYIKCPTYIIRGHGKTLDNYFVIPEKTILIFLTSFSSVNSNVQNPLSTKVGPYVDFDKFLKYKLELNSAKMYFPGDICFNTQVNFKRYEYNEITMGFSGIINKNDFTKDIKYLETSTKLFYSNGRMIEGNEIYKKIVNKIEGQEKIGTTQYLFNKGPKIEKGRKREKTTLQKIIKNRRNINKFNSDGYTVFIGHMCRGANLDEFKRRFDDCIQNNNELFTNTSFGKLNDILKEKDKIKRKIQIKRQGSLSITDGRQKNFKAELDDLNDDISSEILKLRDDVDKTNTITFDELCGFYKKLQKNKKSK